VIIDMRQVCFRVNVVANIPDSHVDDPYRDNGK
jgi:hypothetical protein